MSAYIVGMIAGAVSMIAPLVYLMNVNVCRATILSTGAGGAEAIAQFGQLTPKALPWLITVVGAVVLILSALMVVYTGLMRLRPRKPQPEEEPQAPEDAEGAKYEG
ncbi:MAG: hypothetical protein J7M08_00615 [Planctomycetes bacterium]|nr:hypothetical protein [Planctomycetota bacterium]